MWLTSFHQVCYGEGSGGTSSPADHLPARHVFVIFGIPDELANYFYGGPEFTEFEATAFLKDWHVHNCVSLVAIPELQLHS